MSALNPDYSKRDCSLPPGCKDLIDVLRLQTAQPGQVISSIRTPPPSGAGAQTHSQTQPLQISSHVTVKELAALLRRKPFQIVADLIELAIIANANQTITFEVAARVAAKYGFIAEGAA